MNLNFTMKEYFVSGGIRHIKPYSKFTMNDFLNLGIDYDIWPTGNVNMITIRLMKGVDFIIVYDIENNQYRYDELEIWECVVGKKIGRMKNRGLFLSKRFKRFDWGKQISIVDEVFDEEEKVLFLSNGVNVHFARKHKVNDYVMTKITTNEEKYRGQIKHILTGN